MKHEEATLQTKLALAASLKKFMAKKPLKKITVSEIITDCDVNRKTFYYHFEDIYDLLKWMLEQEAIEVVKKFDLLIDYEDAIRFVVKYVSENAYILNCAYDYMGRDELKRFFYNDCVSVIRKVVEDTQAQQGVYVDKEFEDFLCDFLTEAIAGMLLDAFRENSRHNHSDIIRDFGVILNSLPELLKRAPQRQE